MAVDADGDFVVTWSSLGQDGSGWGVYAQRYNAAGVAQGGEFRVNTTTANDQLYSMVAMDADGDFVVTWWSRSQDGSGYGVYAQRYNAAGVAQGGEFRVNTTTTDHQFCSAVAMDADGDFTVAWSSAGQDGSGYGVYAQRYANSVNAAPTITSSATPTVAENSTAVLALAATDPNADTVTFSVVGGADQALFQIVANQLQFIAPPDYESPQDLGGTAGDNVYEVTVRADDGNGGTTDQPLSVTVTAVNDNNPAFTSSAVASVAENTTAVTTLAATDADLPAQTVTFSIVGGADQALFQIVGNQLQFIAVPDYESPQDLGGAAGDNVYQVTVRADDGNGGTTDQPLSVTVTNRNDAPVLVGANNLASINENQTGNAGSLVSSLIAGKLSDEDAGAKQGIAIYAVAGGNGFWQYYTSAATGWQSVGTVSTAGALLLRSTDRVRFVPNGANGTTASISFCGWDQTAGAVEDKVSIASRGGATAFSVGAFRSLLAVTSVNDAPVLTGANDFATITEDQTGNAGSLVSSLIAGKASDVDTGAKQGVAIYGVVNGNGTWQYYVSAAQGWRPVGTVSAARPITARVGSRWGPFRPRRRCCCGRPTACVSFPARGPPPRPRSVSGRGTAVPARPASRSTPRSMEERAPSARESGHRGSRSALPGNQSPNGESPAA